MKKKRIRNVCAIILVLSVVVAAKCAQAEEQCVHASKKLTEDAQNIRLQALDIRWEVGKLTSIVAAMIIEGKVKIYPKDDVHVCLREHKHRLQIRAQSMSEDAGRAEWHDIKAKKISSPRSVI